MLQWQTFDGHDAPEWLTEEQANLMCSVLNSYIPRAYSTRGTRYHMLNRYPSGRLFFHLLNRPVGV
jgi:hypothetical protein